MLTIYAQVYTASHKIHLKFRQKLKNLIKL